ncbi:MAG: hypothetical protein ABIT38_01865, partial [Gemmatimonadaceae bacterium]
MSRLRTLSVAALALAPSLLVAPAAPQKAPLPRPALSAGGFTLQQVKSYPFPNELSGASSANRIAWAF